MGKFRRRGLRCVPSVSSFCDDQRSGSTDAHSHVSFKSFGFAGQTEGERIRGVIENAACE